MYSFLQVCLETQNTLYEYIEESRKTVLQSEDLLLLAHRKYSNKYANEGTVISSKLKVEKQEEEKIYVCGLEDTKRPVDHFGHFRNAGGSNSGINIEVWSTQTKSEGQGGRRNSDECGNPIGTSSNFLKLEKPGAQEITVGGLEGTKAGSPIDHFTLFRNAEGSNPGTDTEMVKTQTKFEDQGGDLKFEMIKVEKFNDSNPVESTGSYDTAAEMQDNEYHSSDNNFYEVMNSDLEIGEFRW